MNADATPSEPSLPRAGSGPGFHAEGATTPSPRRARRNAPVAVVSVVVGVAAASTMVLVGGIWEVAIAVALLGPLTAWLMARGRLADLGMRRPAWGLAVAAGAAVLVAAVMVGSVSLAAAAGLLEIQRVDLPSDERAGRLITAVIAGMLITGVGEELAYRGALLRLVAAWRGGATAVVASGLLFALAHVPTLLDQDLGGASVAVRLLTLGTWGAVLAIVAWRTGSLWLPIGWHAGANLLNEAARAYVTVESAVPEWVAGTGDGLARGDGVLGVAVTLIEVLVLLVLARQLARRVPGALQGAKQFSRSSSHGT